MATARSSLPVVNNTNRSKPTTTSSCWQKQITCRYYKHGRCTAGKNCGYLHDGSKTVGNVCRFYREGNCCFGEHCKFAHDASLSLPSPLSPSPTKIQSFTSRGKPSPVQSLPADLPHKLTTLRPGGKSEIESKEETGSKFNFEDVVGVAEFVPGQPYRGSTSIPSSYSSAAKKGNPEADDQTSQHIVSNKDVLCPFASKGICRYGDNCSYTHGNVCDLCNTACLHPFDLKQNSLHREECIKNHETSMQESFALQRSLNVTCSICLEVVIDKTNPNDQKFGILVNCTHCFCLKCIRHWRSSKHYEKKFVRTCPVCRVSSNFICPSDYWVDDKDEKKILVDNYKEALRQKPCKYFNKGDGTCPFGPDCFYRHAYRDGSLQDRSKAVRRYGNGDGNLKIHNPISLWDFFAGRENWDSDEDDDFFLLGPSFRDFEESDIEDFYLYQALFGSDSDDEEDLDDIILGMNMLSITLAGSRGVQGLDHGAGEALSMSQATPSTGEDADDGDSEVS